MQNNGKEMSKNVIGHFKVLCSVLWPLSRSEAAGNLVSLQTFLFFICKWSCSRACWHENTTICTCKTGRLVTKQGHRQPRFYSKARALSTQPQNGLIGLCWFFTIFVVFAAWYYTILYFVWGTVSFAFSPGEIYTAISRKTVEKNVHATIPKFER